MTEQSGTPSSPENSGDLNFQITPEGDGSWLISMRFRKSNLLSMETTVERLHKIKQTIAEKFNEKIETLEFGAIAESSDNKLFLSTTLRVTRTKVEQGDPSVNYLPVKNVDGYEYPNMIASLSLYPLDHSERPITKDRILQMLKLTRIANQCLDDTKIDQALQLVETQRKPLKEFEIARGKIPDQAKDAEIEFFIAVDPGMNDIDQFISSHRVTEGQEICRKIYPEGKRQTGYNVFGETVESPNGLDVQLIAGDGASLALNGNSINSNRPGLVIVNRTTRRITTDDGDKIMPVKVEVAVRAIRTIDSDEKIELATDEPIEIVGNVKSGSEITSTSEVIITGSLEANVKIQSQSNIIIGGNVAESSLTSGNHLVIRGSATGSQLSARESVVIEGSAIRTTITGETVEARTLVASSLIANQYATIGSISTDEERAICSIVLGMSAFYKQRIRDNAEFIAKADMNLTRLQAFFGREVIDDLKSNTVQMAFVRYLARIRRERREPLKQIEITLHRKLLESIPPSQALILTRKQESISLQRRLDEAMKRSGSVLTITDYIGVDTLVKIDDVEQQLKAPMAGPMVIRAGESGELDIRKSA